MKSVLSFKFKHSIAWISGMLLAPMLILSQQQEVHSDVSKSIGWTIEGLPDVQDYEHRESHRQLQETATQLSSDVSKLFGMLAADSQLLSERATGLRIQFDFLWRITSDSKETSECVGPSGLFDPSDSLVQRTGAELELRLPLRVRIKRCVLDQARYNRGIPLTLMGHEAFHALHFVTRPGEPSWLAEGLAQYFESLVFRKLAPEAPLYLHPSHVEAAVKDAGTSLTESGVDAATDGKPASAFHSLRSSVYGHQLLFTAFWVNRCGGASAFWRAALGPHSLRGMAGLERALAQNPEAPGFCHHFPDLFTMFEISRFHRQLDRARNADFRFFDLGTETQTKKKLRPNVVEAQPSWSAIPVTVSKVQLNSKGELDETAIGSSQRVVFTSTRFPHRVSDKAEIKPNQEEYEAILLTYDLEDSRVMSTLRFD